MLRERLPTPSPPLLRVPNRRHGYFRSALESRLCPQVSPSRECRVLEDAECSLLSAMPPVMASTSHDFDQTISYLGLAM